MRYAVVLIVKGRVVLQVEAANQMEADIKARQLAEHRGFTVNGPSEQLLLINA